MHACVCHIVYVYLRAVFSAVEPPWARVECCRGMKCCIICRESQGVLPWCTRDNIHAKKLVAEFVWTIAVMHTWRC
jgi:hypothetical protein